MTNREPDRPDPDKPRRRRLRQDARDPGILLEVGKRFYESHQSKSEIAKEFDTNVTQVTRWLERAKADGVVEVRFNPPRATLLEERLRGRYDCLREVMVSTIPEEFSFRDHIQILGQTAAAFFLKIVEPGKQVGISGGNTMAAMIESLEIPDNSLDISIYPTAMIGRGPHIGEHIDPMVTVTLLWIKCGRQRDKAYCATVPPFRPGTTLEDALKSKAGYLNNPNIKAVIDGMRDLDFVFASTGPLGADATYYATTGPSVIREVFDLGVTEEWLKERGIVGDINYSFFDSNGETQPDWEFFLGLPLGSLREMVSDVRKRVVLVAGRYKLPCIRAALRGRLCSGLVTDHVTAAELLDN